MHFISLQAPDSKPPFDANQIADQMTYYEVHAVNEQPQWRKALIKKHGPAGVTCDGYNNYASAAIWEWDWSAFGDWSVDDEGDLKFDGSFFWQRKENNRRKKVQLEEWLKERMLKNNPKAFEDGKWTAKKMWFELIRIMEVRLPV